VALEGGDIPRRHHPCQADQDDLVRHQDLGAAVASGEDLEIGLVIVEEVVASAAAVAASVLVVGSGIKVVTITLEVGMAPSMALVKAKHPSMLLQDPAAVVSVAVVVAGSDNEVALDLQEAHRMGLDQTAPDIAVAETPTVVEVTVSLSGHEMGPETGATLVETEIVNETETEIATENREEIVAVIEGETEVIEEATETETVITTGIDMPIVVQVGTVTTGTPLVAKGTMRMTTKSLEVGEGTEKGITCILSFVSYVFYFKKCHLSSFRKSQGLSESEGVSYQSSVCAFSSPHITHSP
jgi:hypothetical protein